MMRCQGLTLLEVLVAAALAAVLTAAAGGWLISVQRGAEASHAHAEREQAWQRVVVIVEADAWYAEGAGIPGTVSDQGATWRIATTHRLGTDGGPGTRLVTWTWKVEAGALERQRAGASARSLGTFPGKWTFADKEGRLQLTWHDERGAVRTWMAPVIADDLSLAGAHP